MNIISSNLLSVVDKELLGLHVLGRKADTVQGGVTEGELVLVEILVQVETGPHTIHQTTRHSAPPEVGQDPDP